MTDDPGLDVAGRLAALRRRLVPAGPLTEVDVRLPNTGRTFRVLQPQDLDRLIDAVEHDPEQNLPYWAELWPSGIALADLLVAEPDLVRGRRVVELGCGLGVTAIAALEAGADLTVTDYAPESLLLCRYSALANAGLEPAALHINWRQPPAELFAAAGAGFPVVLAADVLYESRDVQPLLALLDRLAAPSADVLLAEPGRPVAARFVEHATLRGWTVEPDPPVWEGPWPDPRDQGTRVTVHRLRRVPS
ncbi:MAG TPA: methyltransferase domain-containing protein [Thermomicrobiaceae bacterium]|nr:methyltransferase domain-containing protein [Thermomicrobiaceae bacterium]